MTVRLPPLEEVARRWHEIEPILKRATDRSGLWEPIDVLGFTMAGKMSVWFVEEAGALLAVAVVEIHQYPRKRVCDVPLIAGRGMARWHAPLLAALEAHARKFQCHALTGAGRRGWARVAGFTESVTLIREL